MASDYLNVIPVLSRIKSTVRAIYGDFEEIHQYKVYKRAAYTYCGEDSRVGGSEAALYSGLDGSTTNNASFGKMDESMIKCEESNSVNKPESFGENNQIENENLSLLLSNTSLLYQVRRQEYKNLIFQEHVTYHPLEADEDCVSDTYSYCEDSVDNSKEIDGYTFV